MNTKQKATRVGVVFIALLIIGGLVLMYKGNDALALATEKKEGILTAEQVKMSFDSVSGRLLNEAVKEGDVVSDYEFWWWAVKQNIPLFHSNEQSDEMVEKLIKQGLVNKVAFIKCPTCNNFH